MVQMTNSENRFGLIAILLHWVMVVLIIGLLGLGLYMVRLPVSEQKLVLYGWHKEFGLLVLGLVIVRLTWRLLNITPSLGSLAPWEKIAARTVHFSFYVFMFLMPITGWLLTSAAGLPPSFFGLFVLPVLVYPSEENRIIFTEIHKWLGYGLILTICGHAGAALKHQFINKDNILQRMLWP